MKLSVIILLSLWTSCSNVNANTAVIRDTKMHPGDKAPFFGVLVSEPRYRAFTNYQDEVDKFRFMIEELDKENSVLTHELDQRPNPLLYFLLGAMIAAFVSK